MYDVRDVLLTLYRREQGYACPCCPMVVSCDANDAYVGCRRVILDYKNGRRVSTVLKDPNIRVGSYSLVREEDTEPQPVSPKFVITLCFSADQMCLLVSAVSSGAELCNALEVVDGHGMSSTRSHLF